MPFVVFCVYMSKTFDKVNLINYNVNMENLTERIDIIRDLILKNAPAKFIYLYGSYAYGNPTEKSDLDIYLVTSDNVANTLEVYSKIMFDLSIKKIFYVDLLLSRESVFNRRKIGRASCRERV